MSLFHGAQRPHEDSIKGELALQVGVDKQTSMCIHRLSEPEELDGCFWIRDKSREHFRIFQMVKRHQTERVSVLTERIKA
jgi:hypothetical protein